MEQITTVQIETLHPHGHNPRIDAAQVEDLVASIREHGIEVPLVAAPSADEDGYVVLGGHRRLTAAHEIGLAEVPVQIREDLTSARDQLAFMATENLMRDQLSPVEEARLVQEMLDLGMSETEVAKQTALGKQRVKDRRRLGKLAEETGEKVHRGQISVDQALVIAEYADDEKSVQDLEAAAATFNFDWAVSRAKQRREQVKVKAEAAAIAKTFGARLVDFETDMVSLSDLVEGQRWTTTRLDDAATGASDTEWTELLSTQHRDCPGHCARLSYGNRLEFGCDQAETQHPAVATTEPEADPWDELTPDGFEAAAVHRTAWLRNHLATIDLTDWAYDRAIDELLSRGWADYGDNQPAIDFLQALTGAEGKAKVKKVLAAWPFPVLQYLAANWWGLESDHRYMTQGKQGTTYWKPTGALRRLLSLTSYSPSPVEERACELATGATWAGQTLAEDGEQA